MSDGGTDATSGEVLEMLPSSDHAPFDLTQLGLRSSALSDAVAAFTFHARSDGTPVSLDVVVTWTRAGDRKMAGELGLRIQFVAPGAIARIVAPANPWLRYASDWFSIAYPPESSSRAVALT